MKPAPRDEVLSRFKVSKFLNDTPLYSKDKRGMNIALLVFQIVWLIFARHHNETIDHMEAIEKYSTRYLKRDDTFRSSCFIKMLLVVPAAQRRLVPDDGYETDKNQAQIPRSQCVALPDERAVAVDIFCERLDGQMTEYLIVDF